MSYKSARRQRYNESPKGRARRRAYMRSAKVKARYAALRKQWWQRWVQTPRGRLYAAANCANVRMDSPPELLQLVVNLYNLRKETKKWL